MKYLLDTVTISDLIKKSPSSKVLSWVVAQADVDLYLSVITIGEIRKGIELARPTNPTMALHFEGWLTSLIANYGNRVLPFDLAASQAWGTMMARAHADIEDSQIAAIAHSRGMTVATKNVADFAPFGISIFNPF